MKSFFPRAHSAGVDTSRPADERYEILGRIASGGMAEIYLARMRVRTGWQDVVLKRLDPELQNERDFIDMFCDEARIASMLTHKNIIEIYELGEIDGSLFISMEFVRGVNLKELHDRSQLLEKKLPIPVILKIACEALEALAYAHEFTDDDGKSLGVVHRDVSPQNVLISYQGQVKLADFGVAKADGRLHKTRPGHIKGRFAFMAPEQILALGADARADIFAVGEVIYQTALGRHPFHADNDAAVIQLAVEARAAPPTSIDPKFPPELAAIVLRALRRDPEERFADARTMRLAIDDFLSSRSKPVATEVIGRIVRELFADRIALEEAARKKGDDDLLVEAFRVGGKVRSAASKAEPDTDESLVDNKRRPPLSPTASSEATLDKTLEGPGLTDSQLAAVFDTPTEASEKEETVVERGRSKSRARSRRDSKSKKKKAAPRPPRPPKHDVSGIKLGKYELVERLGRGSMAEVFLALQSGPEGFEKKIAIKRIRPDLTQEPEFVELFLREARLASRLSHPNMVQILDLGLEQNQYFLAMEYIDGWDLQKILDRCRAKKTQVPVSIACRVLSDVLAALSAAHTSTDSLGREVPILHRDVAPQNVLVSRRGVVKLTDFGIARAADVTTVSSEIRGKPAYSAPERLAGHRSALDPRTDIYSAGVVLYETLTLKPVFVRDSWLETVLAVLRDEVQPVSTQRSEIPMALDAIVACATARLPQDRYLRAYDMQLELERFLTKLGQPVTSAHVASWLSELFAKKNGDTSTDATLHLDKP